MTGKQTREWLKEKIFGPSDQFDYPVTDGGAGTPPAA
jgi:hypothetical protein